MTQKARPIKDDSNATWYPQGTALPGNNPLSDRLRELTPDDTNYVISSGNNSQPDTFQVTLSTLSQPASVPSTPSPSNAPPACPNPQPTTLTLDVRLKADNPNIPVTLTLRQGPDVIATRTVTASTAFADYALAIKPEEISQIKRYDDLHLQVTAGTLPCCPQELPNQLHATFSSLGSTCDCLNGLSVPLTWNPSQSAWLGSLTFPATCTKQSTIPLKFYCGGGSQCWDYRLDTTGANCLSGGVLSPSACSCDPFSVTFHTPQTDCCHPTSGDGFAVTVTL